MGARNFSAGSRKGDIFTSAAMLSAWPPMWISALRQVIAEHGGMSAAEADKYVANLVRAGKYQRDVY